MRSFDYIRPSSIAEAARAAAEPDTAVLAGGTNLLDLMKVGVVRPGRIVDITHLPGLDAVDWRRDGSVRIGGLVRNSDLAHDARFAAHFPAVAEALLSGASGQLRNAATLGGNLMQETRCSYFFDPSSACNRREAGAGCDALDGENRGHAVLGWSRACIATHPSDLCVPLAALGALVHVEGASGSRDVPLTQFHSLPGATAHERTALEPGELIVGVTLPAEAAAFAGHSRYLKVRERTSYAFAVVSAAAALDLDANSRIRGARLALGGVAARPWRCEAAEAVLVGQAPTTEAFGRAAEAALEGAAPSGDNAYKIALARRIVVRTLQLALAGTPDRLPALPASPFAPVPEGALHV